MTLLIVKVTISSIVIDLSKSSIPLIHLSFTIIGQFVIGQFESPINQSHSKFQFK